MRFGRVLLASVDVIVIGGGHAGCEAAAAASRMGAKTMLVTPRMDTIGEMSCNPSFGGVGKGHLMREVDALDGVCCRICDNSGTYYKVLNRSRGPAVWGLRAHIDRKLYKSGMQKAMMSLKNLEIREASVEDLIVAEDDATNEPGPCTRPRINGVRLSDESCIFGKSVIVTTGTFLRGEIFIGNESRPAGRFGEDATYGISKTLDRLGFRLSRLRTGTPPRLDSSTVDLSICEEMKPDAEPMPFSFLNDKVWLEPHEQHSAYMTRTNPGVNELVKNSLHENDHLEGDAGSPRYCPSLESKVLRFPDRTHLIWLELEGFDSDLIYPNGISMTPRADVQQAIVNKIHGLEKAKIIRPGYEVHYDFVDPR